jgi:hypothetical protein
MFRLEKRLTSFFRKNTEKTADYKKWTLHKSYETLADAEQAYAAMIAKSRQGLNWRIVAGCTVIKTKNS